MDGFGTSGSQERTVFRGGVAVALNIETLQGPKDLTFGNYMNGNLPSYWKVLIFLSIGFHNIECLWHFMNFGTPHSVEKQRKA